MKVRVNLVFYDGLRLRAELTVQDTSPRELIALKNRLETTPLAHVEVLEEKI